VVAAAGGGGGGASGVGAAAAAAGGCFWCPNDTIKLQPDHEPLNQRPDHADDFVLPTAVRMIAHQSNTQCRDVGLIKSHQKQGVKSRDAFKSYDLRQASTFAEENLKYLTICDRFYKLVVFLLFFVFDVSQITIKLKSLLF
jgi:hypothetical protein